MSEQPVPGVVTLRYWAGARQAAGVAEETVDPASLAEVLDVVRGRHAAAFTRVLAVCSFVVGEQPVGRHPHPEVTLVAGDVVEVLPPFAGGAPDRPPAQPDAAVSVATASAPRWQVAALAVLAGLALLAAAQSGEAAVLLVAVLLQLPLLAGWHRGLAVPDASRGTVVAGVLAVAADVAVWVDDGPASLAPVAAVVGAGFLLGAAQQLARRDDRSRLTESFAATTSLGAMVAFVAAWPVLVRLPGGAGVTGVAAGAVALASLGRLVVPLAAGVVAVPAFGLAAGLVLGGRLDGVSVVTGAVLGVAVSLPVLVADVLDRRDPRLVVRAWPAAAVWPYALAAPLAYLVARAAGS